MAMLRGRRAWRYLGICCWGNSRQIPEARFRWIACDCLWRVRARPTQARLRHAVPLLRKRRQNDVVIRAKHWELWRVLTLAQAEAYATERQVRRPEASGTKNES